MNFCSSLFLRNSKIFFLPSHVPDTLPVSPVSYKAFPQLFPSSTTSSPPSINPSQLF